MKLPIWFRVVRVIFQLCVVLLVGWALLGCSWFKSAATDVKDGIVDCTKAESVKVVHDLAPLAEVALVQAVGPDNKVDWAPIKSLFKDAALDVGGCALAAAVQRLLVPPQPQAGAPKSSELAVDRAALLGAWRAFADSTYGGAVFKTSKGAL